MNNLNTEFNPNQSSSLNKASQEALLKAKAQPKQAQQQPQQNYVPTTSAIDQIMAITRRNDYGSGSGKLPSEVLEHFKSISEYALRDNNPLPMQAIVVEDVGFQIPTVLLYAVNAKVAYYVVFLLEGAAPEVQNTVQRIPGGREVEEDRYTAQYYDKYFADMVKVSFTRQLATMGVQINAAVAVTKVVIPRAVSTEEQQYVAPFWVAAYNAIYSVIRIDNKQPSSGLTAKLLTNQALKVTAQVHYTPGQCEHLVTSDIVYSDIDLTLSVGQAQVDNQSLHNTGVSTTLSNVKGYIDFMWKAPHYAPTIPGQQATFDPSVGFDPLFVITSISSRSVGNRGNDDIMTLMFGLAGLSGTIADGKWAQIFSQSTVMQNSPKPSIGNLGFGINPMAPGAPFEPKEVDIAVGNILAPGDNNKLTVSTAVQYYTTPSMTVALDIRQGGPDEWLYAILATATRGSVSERDIITELDAFSGGVFSDIWLKAGSPSVLVTDGMGKPELSSIHLGTYTDNDGRVQDIRKIDCLTMLKSCAGDPSQMALYALGAQPNACNLETLDNRRKILQTYAPNVKFNGMATRILLNVSFIMLIERMFAACNIQFGINGLGDMNTGAVQAPLSTPPQPFTSNGAFTQYTQAAAAAPVAQYDSGLLRVRT